MCIQWYTRCDACPSGKEISVNNRKGGNIVEFKEVVKNRYSCKKYSDKKVSEDKLKTILEAGRLAPTAKNLQEQHIYVATSKEALEKIDVATPCRYGASTVLVVAYDKTNVYLYPEDRKNSGDEDATIIATHMILAAADEEVNSCWINNFNHDVLHELLGLPDNEEILMLMDLGYAAEGTGPLPNHSKRKDIEATVSYI